MKLFKNPFFYLSLVLAILLGFQVGAIVRGADWVGPTDSRGFPYGNPAAPLYQSNAIQQDPTSGALVAPVAAGSTNGVTLGNGFVGFSADTSIQTTNNGLAFTPLTSGNLTLLYFGSAGFRLNQMGSALGNALTINVSTPSASLDTGFNLDFNGSINAKSFYVNGVPFVTDAGGQWTINGNDIYYNQGGVAIGANTNTAGFNFEAYAPMRLYTPNADTHTRSINVCADNDIGIIYTRSGSLGQIWVAGTGNSDARASVGSFTDWGVNCANNAKVQGNNVFDFATEAYKMYEFDWNYVPAGASLTATAGVGGSVRHGLADSEGNSFVYTEPFAILDCSATFKDSNDQIIALTPSINRPYNYNGTSYLLGISRNCTAAALGGAQMVAVTLKINWNEANVFQDPPNTFYIQNQPTF